MSFVIEDSFDIHGRGVVVVGRLDDGAWRRGQTVHWRGMSAARDVVIVRIQKLRQDDIEVVTAGDERVGFELSGVTCDEINRGDVLTTV